MAQPFRGRNQHHTSDRGEESSFEELEFPPPLRTSLRLDDSQDNSGGGEVGSGISTDLTKDQFSSFFDCDGRLINEHQLRRCVFRGGVHPEIRKQVWLFLFQFFPFNSTKRERDIMVFEYHMKYMELKKRWKEQLNQVKFCNPDDLEILSPAYLAGMPETPGDQPSDHLQIAADNQQIQYLTIQAKVFSGRLSFDIYSLLPFIRIIDKDVPRTDRELDYFSGPGNRHIQMLRDILLTYAAFNPKLGYTQGMNDIAARFLIVLDDEVEAFWCFSNFMHHIQENFVEDGLLNKLKHVRHLLAELDPDLYDYLTSLDVIDLTFCHRWMLLNFKREFNLSAGLRCFEILSSHYLELSSLEAQRAREEQKRKDFAYFGGTNRLEEPLLNSEFTFDVFMCATILIMKRDALFRCRDASDVFQLICGLNTTLELDVILRKSEVLFFKYCSKSVTDCFQLLG